MFKRKFCQLLALALLSPAASFALGLGEIHLKSALNAPLDAEIDVVGASPEDLSGLKARLASREAFVHAGLDYPGYLSTLSLTAEKAADGRNVLHLHSTDSVSEPFATLLVEADWPRGHVVREYTVLIDPPVFSAPASAAAATVAAPSTGAAARSGAVERPAAERPAERQGAAAASSSSPGSSPTSASRSASASASGGSNATAGSPAAADGSYTVRSGDTLSSVAARNYPGSDHAARERQLVAIYRSNPNAFDGNMNLLRAGSKLQLPGDADLAAISPGEASSEVHRQYQSWSGRAAGAPSGSGQLHLVPPQQSAQTPSSSAPNAGQSSAASGAAAAAAASANSALNQRVQQLESQLAESQRQLQLRNSEMAQLQARASQSASAPAPAKSAAPVVQTPPPAVVTPAPVPPAAEVAPKPAPVETPPAVIAPTTPAPPKPVSVQPSPAPGNSIVDLIEEYWYVPAGLLAILIALVAMRIIRSRQEDEFDRSVGRLHPAFESTSTVSAVNAADTMPVRTLASASSEQSYRVEESGSHEQPTALLHEDTAEVPAHTTTAEHVVIDDTVTGEQPVALDQGDPLAEADFHMAYGLYDQAADLVQIAMSREPNRRDLKLKLLEVFFVWGNKDRFLQSARELASTRDQALPGEWEKIVIMGRQIAPEDPLFSTSATLSGAAHGGVDLNLEGGQNRVDFDLLGEPTASTEGHGGGAALDLDLSAALGDTGSTGEVDKLNDSGVDFVLDDPDRGNDSTGTTREMPEAPPRTPATGTGSGTGTATMQVIGSGSAPTDTPTIEQPQLRNGENSTIREKIDAASRGSTADQTAELALDDLGLDLGALEGTGDETGEQTMIQGGVDAPTMLTGMDEETRRQLDEEVDHDRTLITPPSSKNQDSGTWLFTDADLTELVPDDKAQDKTEAMHPTEIVTQIQPSRFDTAATGRMQTINTSGLDLNLDNLSQDKPSNGIDLDVGAASAGEGTFIQTQRIMQPDVPLPELEPATMSEVGTKLDLARAYMDMGDPEGARSILAEVLSEGSVSQKQEARRLMDTLPG